MKNNFIKYIFVFFIAILIGFAIYKIASENKNKNEIQEEVENQAQKTIEKDLRLAIVNYDSINPILSKNSNVQNISRLVFEPLITMDKDYKLKPCLAKEWSMSGDTAYIIKLRDDVKWHDGSKFTSKDVKFTIEKLREVDSIYSYNVQNITQVDIIDDYTLRITLNAKDNYFEYKLIFPILSNNFYLEQDFQTTEKNNVPMGTGMYKITSNDGGTILIKKNQNWWNIEQKNAKIEEIKVSIFESMGDAYNNFKIGNIDILPTQNENLEKYVGTLGYNKIEYKGREYDFLVMNCANKTLSNVNVRKAIDYSIDKANIVATVFNGKYYTCDFPLDFGIWLYNAENSSAGYNPDQSKKILEDDGWEFKKGYWQKTENYRTERLSLTLTVSQENPQRAQVAEIIKNNLETVGINVRIASVSTSTYISLLENSNYDLMLAGMNIGLNPDINLYLGDNNIANFDNEEAKEILNDIGSITDESILKEKYKKLAEIYKDESPYKSLYLNKRTIIYSNNLICDMKPNNYNIFYGIENWYRET